VFAKIDNVVPSSTNIGNSTTDHQIIELIGHQGNLLNGIPNPDGNN
jgi:hypothetical protein